MAESTLNVTTVPGSLPAGYCWPASPQTYYNDIIDILSAYISGEFNLFAFGASEPDPASRGLPWIKVDALNNFDGLYTYGQFSVWARPHPTPASGDERRLWVGTEASLQTYDGGEIAAVTATTGPFWEVDHDFDFRVPLGPGTSPDGTVVAEGDNGGEEFHVLAISEMPLHGHPYRLNTLGGFDISDPTGGLIMEATAGSNTNMAASTATPSDTAGQQIGGEGGGLRHQNMPPYRGCFLIKRTARIYYRG